MGLQMTLPKDKNHMNAVFVDAYWSISALSYDIEAVNFTLTCYPSREAKLLAGTPVLKPSIGGFGKCQTIYRPELYSWAPFFSISQVFKEGIPLGRDAQLRQIYTFIKAYTGLSFEDVFESDQTEEETEEEPSEESVQEPSSAEELYVEPIQEANTDTDEPQVEAEREEIENGIN